MRDASRGYRRARVASPRPSKPAWRRPSCICDGSRPRLPRVGRATLCAPARPGAPAANLQGVPTLTSNYSVARSTRLATEAHAHRARNEHALHHRFARQGEGTSPHTRRPPRARTWQRAPRPARHTQRGALDTRSAHASSDGADRREPPSPVTRTRTAHAALDARGAHASGNGAHRRVLAHLRVVSPLSFQLQHAALHRARPVGTISSPPRGEGTSPHTQRNAPCPHLAARTSTRAPH